MARRHRPPRQATRPGGRTPSRRQRLALPRLLQLRVRPSMLLQTRFSYSYTRLPARPLVRRSTAPSTEEPDMPEL
eukprot:5529213-Lingulodinium_polyedra.AAC.1